MCVEVCPHGVFKMEEQKARIQNPQFCMECGACAKNCPAKALLVDSGVGCAQAVLYGWIHKTEPACGCSKKSGCC